MLYSGHGISTLTLPIDVLLTYRYVVKSKHPRRMTFAPSSKGAIKTLKHSKHDDAEVRRLMVWLHTDPWRDTNISFSLY